MEAPNPNKRLCQNPNSFSNVPDFNQNHVDLIISSFLLLPDSPSLSSPLSIGCSFDRALEKLFEASGDSSVQGRLIDRGLEIVSLLHESTKRWYRKHAILSNSDSWPLPHELTVKVFSMLDTKSMMQASACCTMLKKCAMDPLCYSHIDLTTGNVDDEVVHSMILHADKELRSLKVGRVPCPNKSSLTRFCLIPLFINQGFSGNLLRSLHLYNHSWLDYNCLRDVFSACSNLTDLKIVVFDRNSSIDELLEFLPRKCEHLFIEKEITPDQMVLLHGMRFVKSCTNLTSLSIIGFEIADSTVYHLINNLQKLKYMNLSGTCGINGLFVRTAALCCSGTLLETLILQDCFSLEKRSVLSFLNSLLKGKFKFIKHIDVSSKHGLISGDGRYCKPKFSLEKLKEKRPGLAFVADFASSDSLSSSLGDTSSGSGSEEDDDDF